MADAVTTTTIQDGDRIAVIQLTNTSDGTGESAVTKIDVSGLATNSSTGKTCTGVKLGKIVYSTFGMSVKLLWVATTNTICWDIALTTTGHASADSYVIVLTLIKEYA